MNTKTSVSFPLPTLLTIIFVILKLTNTITWSWLWVLSPLWISALILIGCFALALLIGVIFSKK